MTPLEDFERCECGHEGKMHHRITRIPDSQWKFRWNCAFGDCECTRPGTRDEYRVAYR
jgi:hypothetical protein